MTRTHEEVLPQPATLAATLRYLRRQRGLTQRHLLRPLHLASHTAIVDFEAGRRIPAAEIIDAYERVLDCRPGLLRQLRDRELARQVDIEPGPPPGAAVVPCQLPAMPSYFTGRRAELAELDALCDAREVARSGVRVGLISGGVGVGKSGLAVAWAHRVSARFPDGQLFADLRARGGTPTSAGQVLAGFLRALGVAEAQLPADVDQAAALFRSLLAGRRVLVVLDDADSSRQVRPLLPGSGTCVTLITSRDWLPGLAVASGVRPIRLGAMPPDEATDLLARLLGLVGRAPLRRLAELCDHLPLALRLAAGHSDKEVGRLVGALERIGPLRLLTCDDGDFDLYAGIDWSYRRLSAAAQQALRLVALAPGPDLSRAALAALVGPARELVPELVAADLVRHGSDDRLRLPGLVRWYAEDRAREDPPTARRRARVRLLRFYLSHAADAARLLYPQMARLPSGPAGSARQGSGLMDAVHALEWLDAERGCMVAVIHDAAARGPAPFTWRLADAVRGYLWLRPQHADWVAVAETVLGCARRGRDPAARALAELFAADAWCAAGRPEEAIAAYRRAVDTADRAEWTEGVAAAHANAAGAYRMLGDLRAAQTALQKALQINRRVANLGGQAAVLDSLGTIHADLSEQRVATVYHARALALYRLIDSPTGIDTAMENLGLATALVTPVGDQLPVRRA